MVNFGIAAAVQALFGRKSSAEAKYWTFKDDMENYKRVEKGWTAADYREVTPGHPSWDLIQQDGDGMWICCRGHENTLTHYRGLCPFKYVYCQRCEEVICPSCDTSGILKYCPSSEFAVLRKKQPRLDQEIRFCRICAFCGLSHRGKVTDDGLRFAKECFCSEVPLRGYVYSIGEVDSWRIDPAGQLRILERQQAQKRHAKMEEIWYPDRHNDRREKRR